MYFNDRMFNLQYVNPAYYNQVQAQIVQYNFEQNTEQAKAFKVFHDMCEAVRLSATNPLEVAGRISGCIPRISSLFIEIGRAHV